MDEIILIDKPVGWTSFGVVAKIRSLLRKSKTGQKIKVGHAGTLDPFASGLLIILIGNATKKQSSFMKLDKEYEAVLKLGYTSSTGDTEGIIKKKLKQPAQNPSKIQIENILKQYFLGTIYQVPPLYSAIKIKGKPAYSYARRGEKIDLKPRKVKIISIKVKRYSYPYLTLKIYCSSGTYIRALAQDIGQKLKTGAYLTKLRRTKIGHYQVSSAQKINKID